VDARQGGAIMWSDPMTAAQACDLMTIGHSNLAADRFIALLKNAGVTAVADVRSVPFSRWCPWFSSKALAMRLADLFRDPASRLADAYRRRARAVAPRRKA
jgi:hypothetical protein